MSKQPPGALEFNKLMCLADKTAERGLIGVSPFLAGCGLILLAAGCDLRSPKPTDHPFPEIAEELIEEWPEPDDRGIVALENRIYVIARYGETVRDIGNRINVNPEQLAAINRVRVETPLESGRALTLPSEFLRPYRDLTEDTASASKPLDISELASNAIDSIADPSLEVTIVDPAPVANQIVHRVQPGETVHSIANLHGVSVPALASWNSLSPDSSVRVNQTLIIPASHEISGIASSGEQDTESETPVQRTSPEQTETPPSTAIVRPAEAESLAQKITGVVTQPETVQKPEAATQENAPNDRSTGFMRPLNGKIIRRYSGKPGGSEGIDIAAPEGGIVVAAADGAVALVSPAADQTVILLLKHPQNIYTVYSNITDVPLERGQKVERGQLIGHVAGGSKEYLHFEIREGTKSTDPEKLFSN